MKKLKVLIILSALIVATGCGIKSNSVISITSNIPTTSIISEVSSETSSEQISSFTITSSKASDEQISSSVEISSEEQPISSFEEESSSTHIVSSSEPSSTSYKEDTTLEVSFYNPTCGTMSTEVLNERLMAYINEVAGTTFVTSITNSKCQIGNDFPTKGNKVLIIGASSSSGSLSFVFKETVKMITITAQTYYKPYTDYQTGNEVPNVDANSVLAIESQGNPHEVSLDLSPENGQPVEKDLSVAINSKTLKLSSVNDEKGRVFIKGITFLF